MKNKIELINRISELEAKVEAANKLLDAFTYEMDMTEMADLLRNLRTALQIPRNREQNFLKPTVCAYKEDVPNCEVIDCNDCPHTMKPRKENQEFPSPEKQQEILREAIDYAKNPRKEKCRVGGVPQNVPSCKELKPEVFRDCQGYTSKIVKKENKQK